MKKEDIHLNDFQRILFGAAPAEFIVEVVIRTIIIYAMVLFILKLMGKRMDGQVSIIEMAVMIVLGAIVGAGTQLPDRGILMAIGALVCVFVFQRGINWLSIKSERVEKLTTGSMNTLVKDGVLQLEQMKSARITRENLFSELRGQEIFNLGKVSRVYFEACGIMNVYEEPSEKPGLPVLPSASAELIKIKTRTDPNHIVCKNCGYVARSNEKNQNCQHCETKEWMQAVL
jgi:uncharacterized membrane protein YcaP (DUF421 family)